MTGLLETVEVETGRAPVASVVWLHGLGADGWDFEPVVPALGLPATLPVRFVFPHAPMRPVTINQGAIMRAWYDVRLDGGGRHEDEPGIRASQARVEALLAREVERGVPRRRIVLAGFSQGGAMALHTGLRQAEPLAGLLALSAFLPLADRVAAEAHPASRAVPILMAHGLHDPLIPLELARLGYETLLGLGYRVEWRTYPIPHAVSPEEIRDVGAWLAGVLAGRA